MSKPVKAGRVVTKGRRFSRREVTIGENIYGYEFQFEAIDFEDIWGATTIERHRRHAREILEPVIDVQQVLDTCPNGVHFADHVLNYLGHEPDSLVGLAAQIFELCYHIEAYQSFEAGRRAIPELAYRLGRRVILLKAYEPESRQQSARAARPRRRVTKAELVVSRDQYEKQYGTTRGWIKAACLEFKIDKKTLNQRMTE